MILLEDSEEQDLLVAGAYSAYGEASRAIELPLRNWRGAALFLSSIALFWLTFAAR